MRLRALGPETEIILFRRASPGVAIGLLRLSSKLSHLPWHVLAAVSKELSRKSSAAVPSLSCPGDSGFWDGGIECQSPAALCQSTHPAWPHFPVPPG